MPDRVAFDGTELPVGSGGRYNPRRVESEGVTMDTNEKVLDYLTSHKEKTEGLDAYHISRFLISREDGAHRDLELWDRGPSPTVANARYLVNVINPDTGKSHPYNLSDTVFGALEAVHWNEVWFI
jgi:hypothetical protein